MALNIPKPKKVGRPPKGPFEDKRKTLSARITVETRTLLELAAEKSGRSLSQEAEYRLDQSISNDDQKDRLFGGDGGYDLLVTFGAMAATVGRAKGKDWWSDPEVLGGVLRAWRVYAEGSGLATKTALTPDDLSHLPETVTSAFNLNHDTAKAARPEHSNSKPMEEDRKSGTE